MALPLKSLKDLHAEIVNVESALRAAKPSKPENQFFMDELLKSLGNIKDSIEKKCREENAVYERLYFS
jgi:hypothetical protein